MRPKGRSCAGLCIQLTVYAVIAEYFGKHAPASTGLIIDGMAHPDMLVEIDATAVLPG